MMKAASVFLCPQITVTDAKKLSGWLRNELVTRYLNEYSNVARDIEELADGVPPHLLTARFNSDGRFFMVCPDGGETQNSIGFVKLSDRPDGFEIVFAIGETSKWGEGFGGAAVAKALATAFFECRAPKVVAKIAPGNVRSEKIINRLGFLRDGNAGSYARYSITFRRYLDIV